MLQEELFEIKNTHAQDVKAMNVKFAGERMDWLNKVNALKEKFNGMKKHFEKECSVLQEIIN